MDDDLRFFKRDKDLKLHKCNEAEIIEAFDLVYRHAASFKIPMVGISTQLGNNRVADDYDEICRVTRCYCVDRKIFKEAGASFAPYEPFCMQDFHVSLTLLEKGYPNRVLYTFAQDDVGSNAAGGCSRYRTFEVLERAAKYLTKVHPGHATFRVKKTKGAWEGMGKQDADGNTFRVDITVRWKEAYKPKERSKQKGFSDFFKEENNGSSKQS
jgi:hypothetical protein